MPFLRCILQENQPMRKSLFALCLFVATAQYAAAQEQYVELVTTDTLMVEPQQWYYFVTYEKPYETDTTVMQDLLLPPVKTAAKKTTPQQPAEDPLAALRKLALANGGELLQDSTFISYTTFPSYSTTYDAAEEPSYLNLKFTSRAGLQGFVKAIGKQPNVRGQLTGSLHPQLASFNDALDAKIMEKAKVKAEKMAQLSGRRLGKILLVSEATDSDAHVLRDFLNQILQMEKTYGRSGSDWKTGLDNLLSPDKIKLEHTLRLRFALQ